ncbi:MAG: cell division protein ZapA [Bacteroidota bacterium]|nr:cell division protein ZapA [Bacteroidota bacterium]|tara:strand:- start:297 stop:584 length:288 start_codon:yes stop_codon:yes gene_type:complete
MSDYIKIKLNIADRLYPLTIERSQEIYFRDAVKKIESALKKLEENYSVRDKQDLLAMACIQFAAKLQKNQTSNSKIDDKIDEMITNMIDSIDNKI